MTATRSFLVLFSLLALALNTAGQICTLDTNGATGIITGGAVTSFTTGSLTGVTGVYIEKGSSFNGKLWVVSQGQHVAFRYPSAYDFQFGATAEATIGTSGASGTTASNLNSPWAITTDKTGNCFLSDTSNSRVLVFPSCESSSGQLGTLTGSSAPYALGASSNAVVGTTVPSTPAGITTSISSTIGPSNPLFVALKTTSYIIGYTNLPTTFDTSATNYATAYGSTTGTGSTTNTLNLPTGIRYYTGASNFLFIADTGNHRVVRATYTAGTLPLSSTSEVDFGTSGTSGCSATALNGPSGVAYDTSASVLYVADTGNSRIVYYSGASGTSTVPVTATFFPSGSATACAASGTGQNNLKGPYDVDVAAASQSPSANEPTVVVADNSNSRVLKLCAFSNSLSITLSGSVSISTASALTPSISLSLSSSVGSAISTSISTTLAATSGGASSTSTSYTSSISYSITTSITNTITTSLTTSITTSLTTSITTSLTTSRSFSITTSQSYSITVSYSYSPSYTSSYSPSYSTSVSTSYSTSSVVFCGDGTVNGHEKCDAGDLNGTKSSCCRSDCRLQRGGRVCAKETNPCLSNRRCDGRGTCRAAVVRVNAPCLLSTNSYGRCNGNGVCSTA